MSDQPSRQQQGQLQQQEFQQQLQSALTGDAARRELAESTDSSQNFLAEYVPPPGVYDENVDEHGKLRPLWAELSGWLAESGEEGMVRRWKQICRTVHQNGIAFSAYGNPSAREQHLQLDPLPQLIAPGIWDTIKTGLVQRAELLNKLLADLYGPRTLLKDGVLPADVLFCNPQYYLPFHGLPPAGGRHLHFYAAELARSPNGAGWVMADRTDAPGGSGFALENRVVISRAFPGEFRRCNVERLAPWFIAMRDHLTGLAPHFREHPHIVILSAGTGSASYFEDAYLSRYLGFTLVEAADLVVRRKHVMLKTISGLVNVDVIIRRQYCNNLDPLELGGNTPGVAGILQVVREGNVSIVNAPGTGLIESPVFMAFMPRICRALTGTDLQLPGVATWWGGEAESLERILDQIDELALLPAFRRRTSDAEAAESLPDPQSMTREQRIGLVQENPRAWVGQERLARSSAAVWEDGKLRSGHVSLRTFLVASGDSYQLMSGGLTRITDDADAPTFSLFQGGGAKDAWVVTDKPVEPISLLKQPDEQLKAEHGGNYVSSRMADNFCWLGRNLERADLTARLLRAVVVRLTGESDPAGSRELPLLVRALAAEGRIDAGFAVEEIRQQLPDLDATLVTSMLDRSEPASLRSVVDQIYFLASKVRERLAPDEWRIVQRIGENFEIAKPEECELADLLEMTNDLIIDLAAFSGLVNESMTRTHALRFLNLGRRLERSMQIVSLLKNCFDDPRRVSSELLEAVLEVSDSIMTYRNRYYANLQMSAVLDLLLTDNSNPRSLVFQLTLLESNIKSLPGNGDDTSELSRERRLTMDALHSVRMAEIPKLCEVNSDGGQFKLLELLTRIEKCLPKISTAVSNRFLMHSGPVHQLIEGSFRSG